jgi:hypothetical protein
MADRLDLLTGFVGSFGFLNIPMSEGSGSTFARFLPLDIGEIGGSIIPSGLTDGFSTLDMTASCELPTESSRSVEIVPSSGLLVADGLNSGCARCLPLDVDEGGVTMLSGLRNCGFPELGATVGCCETAGISCIIDRVLSPGLVHPSGPSSGFIRTFLLDIGDPGGTLASGCADADLSTLGITRGGGELTIRSVSSVRIASSGLAVPGLLVGVTKGISGLGSSWSSISYQLWSSSKSMTLSTVPTRRAAADREPACFVSH